MRPLPEAEKCRAAVVAVQIADRVFPHKPVPIKVRR